MRPSDLHKGHSDPTVTLVRGAPTLDHLQVLLQMPVDVLDRVRRGEAMILLLIDVQPMKGQEVLSVLT